MTFDWVTIINQVPSVVMALLFAWFCLNLLDRTDKASEKRDDAWREFLGQEREARKEMTARLAEEIKENSSAIVLLAELFRAHDSNVSAAVKVMQDRTQNAAKKGDET